MPFAVLPVVEAMLDVYALPRDQARFNAYLRLLQGSSKADLQVPVLHYNPMAKEPLVEKLRELQQLGAEGIAAAALQKLAAAEGLRNEPEYQVALNLADDVHGGWTNRYTTDFANTFDLGALVKRHCCTPLFWASESYTPELVTQRTLAQVWRTRYRAQHSLPRTLAEHVAQERFVARRVPTAPPMLPEAMAAALATFEAMQRATDQPTLMTFFYGDPAAEQLGYYTWGQWPAFAGFRLTQALANADLGLRRA